MTKRGFCLLEALMAMLVIGLLIPAVAAGLGAVARFSKKINDRTEAIACFEILLFETGKMTDRKKSLPGACAYTLKEDLGPALPGFSRKKISFQWNGGKEALECEVVLPDPVSGKGPDSY